MNKLKIRQGTKYFAALSYSYFEVCDYENLNCIANGNTGKTYRSLDFICKFWSI